MNPRYWKTPLLLILLTLGTSVVFAQPQPRPDTPTGGTEEAPLARKQRMIHDRYTRFQDRIFRLREELSETEPENAQRLAKVLERSGELGLKDRLEDIIRLLDDAGSSGNALDAQTKWVEDADALLNILMQRDGENDERRSEIERLKAYQERVQRLLKEQRSLRDDVDQQDSQSALGQQIEQALGQLDNLRGQQDKLSKDTAAKGDGAADEKSLEQQQESLAEQAEALAEQVEKIAEKMKEENSAEQDEDSPKKSASQASKSLSKASDSMSKAKQGMQSGDESSTKSQQQSAKESLDQAKEKLEQAKKKLDQEKKKKDVAKRQEELSKETEQLADQMKSGQSPGSESQQGKSQSGKKSDSKSDSKSEQGQKSPQSQKGQESQKGEESPKGKKGEKGKQGPKGEQGEKGQADKQQQQQDESDEPVDEEPPGLENIENAEQEMKDAAESLKQEKSEEALPQQDRAIEELQLAELELEEALSQLRQEDRAETLRHLEARFRVLLSKQKAINAETLVLDHIGRDAFKRPEKLQIAELSAKQGALSEQAASCAHILDEDGTTIVFPYVVEQITKDMQSVSQRLSLLRTGMLTQAIEQEIIDALEQLLDAVKKMQQENEEQGGGQGQQQKGKKDDSLLPLSGELKLLKSMQLRINSRTTAIHNAHEAGDEPEDALLLQLKATSSRQLETEGVAKEMRERVDTP